MKRLAFGLVAPLLLLGAAPPPAIDTEGALRLLLAAAATPIAPSSTCYGIIPGVKRPTLGDFLATPLAAMDGGTNRIGGGCKGGRCEVQITHSAGEDVFSYQYRFRTAGGRLVPASLTCFSTP